MIIRNVLLASASNASGAHGGVTGILTRFQSQVSSPKVGILKRGPALVILRRQEVGFAQFIDEGCAND